MKQVFLSYSRTDQPFAIRLATDLRKAGVEIWMDRSEIAPAEHWDEEIQRGIDASRGLLILISEASVNSDNVLNEINYAIERKKLIWPILLQRDVIKPLNINRLQHIDFSQNYNTALSYLIHALMDRPFTGPVTRADRKQQWIIGSIATVIIIALCLFFLRGTFSSGVRPASDSTVLRSNAFQLNGSWITAEMTNPFDRNDKYTMQFNIRSQDSLLSGNIESKSTPAGKNYKASRSFNGGHLEDRKFSFFTHEESIQGSETIRYKNFYTGSLINNELHIVLTSDRPWEFPEQTIVAKFIQ